MQKAAAGSFLLVVLQHWHHCYLMEKLWLFSNSFMCVISVSTANAISADRLLALSWGIRYRQVVTIKRAPFLVVLLLLVFTGTCFLLFTNEFASLVFHVIICSLWLVISTHCYTRIYLTLNSHSGSNYSTRPPQWDIAALLLVRYKITVSSALWVFAAMMISYLPYISIFNLILPVLLSVLH